eukprot:COSAG02_NODE_8824_length_2430_cov_1.687822_3_plen_286_part_00
MVDVLGNKLGNEFFQLSTQFHHVIWMGDLNYRLALKKDQLDVAVDMIKGGDCGDLFEQYDELRMEMAKGVCFHGYVEPPLDYANFAPSYKKYKEREGENHSDPDWVEKTYLVDYKQQWYKGGKNKVRIPAWCDRVLVHSLPDCRDNVSFSDYRSIIDHFLTSDHSPVQAIVTLQAKRLPTVATSMYKMRAYNCRVIKEDGSPFSQAPRHVKCIAPAPFEVTDRPPVAKKLEMADIGPGQDGTTWFFTGTGIQLAESGARHHFLAKVAIDASPCCIVAPTSRRVCM